MKRDRRRRDPPTDATIWHAIDEIVGMRAEIVALQKWRKYGMYAFWVLLGAVLIAHLRIGC